MWINVRDRDKEIVKNVIFVLDVEFLKIDKIETEGEKKLLNFILEKSLYDLNINMINLILDNFSEEKKYDRNLNNFECIMSFENNSFKKLYQS